MVELKIVVKYDRATIVEKIPCTYQKIRVANEELIKWQ